MNKLNIGLFGTACFALGGLLGSVLSGAASPVLAINDIDKGKAQRAIAANEMLVASYVAQGKSDAGNVIDAIYQPVSNVLDMQDAEQDNSQADKADANAIHNWHSRIFGVDDGILSWDDIEEIAPHLSYGEKLDIESQYAQAPNATLKQLMAEHAPVPNTGDLNKDILYRAVFRIDPNAGFGLLFLENAVNNRCGVSLSSDQLTELFVTNGKTIQVTMLKKDLKQFQHRVLNQVNCADL